jgi:hypothetical protein
MQVNVWDVVEDLKAVVASCQEVHLDRLIDPDVALRDLVSQGGRPDTSTPDSHLAADGDQGVPSKVQSGRLYQKVSS